MRKLLIIFPVVIITISAILYWALNSKTVTKNIVPPIANIFLKDIRITELLLTKQRFNIDGSLTFDNMIIKLSDKAGEMAIAFKHFNVSSIYALLGATHPVKIHAQNGTFIGMELVIDDVGFDGVFTRRPKNDFEIDGDLSIKTVTTQKLAATEISGHIAGMLDEIQITSIIAQFYGGSVNATVLCKPDQNGYIEMFLTLDDIDISKIAHDRPDLVSQVDGIANISITVQAAAGAITDMQADMVMTKRSMINAAVLQFLINYIPQSAERNELALLIKEQRKIELDKTIVKVTNFDSEKMTIELQLSSKRINLDLNLTLDLIVEGGLMNLLALTDMNKQEQS
ncbi:MAG: hypothetical protein JW938_06870 [Candidatus Omnitrophica bacterium]|nr:hypothetical protein [Candidatus Omnitrophota bacterium]